MGNARYQSAAEALVDLEAAYKQWSQKLTDTSITLAFALIAANWAIYGNDLRSLLLPRLSVAAAFLAIITVQVTAMLMVNAHDEQHAYAEQDPLRWDGEWSASKESSTPWPYTRKIERIGEVSRMFRFWFPIVGCALLAASFI